MDFNWFFFFFLKEREGVQKKGCKRLWLLLVSRKEVKKKRYVFSAAHLLCWHIHKCPHGAALELRCSARAPVCRVHQQFHHLSCRNCFSSESSLDFKQSSVTLQIIFYFIFLCDVCVTKKRFVESCGRVVHGLKPSTFLCFRKVMNFSSICKSLISFILSIFFLFVRS